jgi:hypothetical protein
MTELLLAYLAVFGMVRGWSLVRQLLGAGGGLR